MRAHNESVNRIDFITGRYEITTSYAPGEMIMVVQHNGSSLRVRKLQHLTSTRPTVTQRRAT